MGQGNIGRSRLVRCEYTGGKEKGESRSRLHQDL